ncbi:hypothetical protein C4X99_04315 [Leptospira interrogans serovar Geyaweera]|nr:hypothetical protein C4X99_04315 [Leptospira interrogans serovar Geyaweera]
MDHSNKSEILSNIKPIIPIIESAFLNAFSEYETRFLSSGIANKSSNRSVASNIHDLIWDHLESSFSISENYNVYFRKHYSKYIEYKDIRFRVKKIDKNGRASNMLSKNSNLFFQPMFKFEEFDEYDEYEVDYTTGINLTLGYTANEARTEFSFPFLVHPKDREEILWMIDLRTFKIETNTTSKIIEFPKQNENLKPANLKPKEEVIKDRKKDKPDSK